MVRPRTRSSKRTSRSSNIALDLIGHASALLALAGEVEGEGRDEDALAYFREGVEFRNALMVELPNGDFGVHDRAAVPVRCVQRAAAATHSRERATNGSRPSPPSV